MPKFLIEREAPGIGQMSAEELQGIADKSNKVLADLGVDIQWVQSYVTGDKLFCIYNARDESLIPEHARIGGFPCDHVRQVTAVIDPVTGGV
jgi:hypothetical protein